MRIRSRRTLCVLIFIGLITAFKMGCEETGPSEQPGVEYSDADTDSDSDADADADSDADADVVIDMSQCEELPDGAMPCDYAEGCEVNSPAEGVAATPFEICMPGDEPIESNRAARITLNQYSASDQLVTGQIEIPADLLGQVAGTPTVSVEDAYPVGLLEMAVTQISSTDTGFTFTGNWPTSPGVYPNSRPYLNVKVTMKIDCGTNTDGSAITKAVESTTYLSYCENSQEDSSSEIQGQWVSSGDTCVVCHYICEMAASPIVPDGKDAALALPREIGVEIVPVMQYGRHLSLVVEPRGTEGPVTYSWMVSAGKISADNLGGIVWEVPSEPGLHQVTVAVQDRSSAGVASLRYRHGV